MEGRRGELACIGIILVLTIGHKYIATSPIHSQSEPKLIENDSTLLVKEAAQKGSYVKYLDHLDKHNVDDNDVRDVNTYLKHAIVLNDMSN
jgi:hypothetical protein